MVDSLKPPEELVARRWLLLLYGIFCVVGLGFITIGVRRYGFSQPAHFWLSGMMFSLSLLYFATTLKSGTALTSRKVGVRITLLLLLLMAFISLSVFH